MPLHQETMKLTILETRESRRIIAPARFEFADGTVLSYAKLLERGFEMISCLIYTFTMYTQAHHLVPYGPFLTDGAPQTGIFFA
jgi:hypothetical protein